VTRPYFSETDREQKKLRGPFKVLEFWSFKKRTVDGVCLLYNEEHTKKNKKNMKQKNGEAPALCFFLFGIVQ